MAPVEAAAAATLHPRDYYRCRYAEGTGYYDCYTPWESWGRWLLLAGVVLVFIVMFLLTCISARRRRKHGLNPYRGTGWLAPNNPAAAYHTGVTGPPPQYNAPGATYPASTPAPQYTTAPDQAGYFGPSAGYYAQQQPVEMQPPSNTYQPQRGGEPVYAPPPGPPPTQAK